MKERHSLPRFEKKANRLFATLAAASLLTATACEQNTAAAPETRPSVSSPIIEDSDWLSTSSHIPEELMTPPLPPPVDCMVKKCIALTFDDGPGAYTPQLLDELQRQDVPATFFVLGSLAEANPKVVKRMHDEGHQVGPHSWSHKQLTRLSPQAAADDINCTNDTITTITGAYPTAMRPPYGSTNDAVIAAVNMPEIMWSVDPQDWKYQSTGYVSSHIISQAGRGAIVLMHDIYGTTVNAVPSIINSFKEQGYTMVTIDQMFGGPLPTGVYRDQDDKPVPPPLPVLALPDIAKPR